MIKEKHWPFAHDMTYGRSWSIALPLCFFAALMLVLVPSHEPWADEAQAWQLARFASVPSLLSKWLHLEMSPGVWHGLLRIESASGLSYAGMHWVTAGIGVIAIFLLLSRSPFPVWIRVLLPFTYFLGYQYPIVARSYSLAPLLLFALAAQWPRRRGEPLTTTLLLALLANVCAQTLTMAIGFAIVLMFEAWRQRSDAEVSQRRVWISLALLWVAIAFGLWCCHPPANAPWVIAVHSWRASAQANAEIHGLSNSQRRLILIRGILHGRYLLFRIALLGGLAARRLLAVPLLLAMVFLLVRNRAARYLWPVGFLAVFGTFSRFSVYHQGLMWLLFLNLLWIFWPARASLPRYVLEASLGLCVLVQLFWSFTVMREEIELPYAPTTNAAPVVADYLAHGREIVLAMPPTPPAVGTPPAFFAVGLQPYFAAQPFKNLSYRYWSWLGDEGARERYLKATASYRAVALVVECMQGEMPDVERLLALGYKPSHRFCATNLYPNKFAEPEVCYTFYEPPGGAPASP